MNKMKKFLYVIFAAMLVIACNPVTPEKDFPKGIEAFNPDSVDGYYGFAEISVPAGVSTIYIENYSGVDEQGHKLNLKVNEINVKPVVSEPENGRDVEPFGTVKMMIESPNKTMVAAYYNTVENIERDDTNVVSIYVLNDFRINRVKYGNFGRTKYVQIPWNYSLGNLDDVYVYNQEHDCTLHYVYAYAKLGNGEGYVLSDMYKIVDGVIVKDLYPNANMPWDVEGFVGNGDVRKTIQRSPAKILSAPGVIDVVLPEPSQYITTDEGHTFYHSSGCVMFEDSWPEVNNTGVYDLDFNDCVIDYDFEARTVDDERLAEEAWREQVKVVLHLRAVGSDKPYRVGVKLEGFDQSNVASIEQHFTLDSYENPHGILPVFTETTVQHNSGHYETDPMNPIVEMAHIFTLNQERAGVGANAEYTYTNGDFVNNTVFNLCYGYKPMDETQYKPELAAITYPTTLANIQKKKWYNAIPGYMNVAGGLITYTVIYHMKDRSQMSAEEREAAKQNMIDAVVNTTSQNFYIINKDWTPIGLKGYEPVFLHSQSISKYNNGYDSGVANGTLDAGVPYAGTNGSVWGIKCPTLTRHIWNKLYFSQAYPHYQEWVQSNGASHQEWYHEDVDDLYLVCWW